MSAVLKAQEPGARYLAAVQPGLVRQFDLLAGAPGGVGRLRELILALAVQGKLVRQNLCDEPASALLKRIGMERTRLAAAGKSGRSTGLTPDDESEPPSSLPTGWAWSTLASIGVINPRINADGDQVASFVQMSSIPVAFTDAHVTEPRRWRDIKSGFTQFAEGDVGVAKITPCFENGKSTVFQNLSNGIGAGTTELHIVRPLGRISPRYVLLFLKNPSFLRDGEATMTGTAGQKRLPRTYFENSPFPLPPLAEQARIVARVDELMRLCDALEAKGRLEAEQHARLLGTLLGTLTDSGTPEELAANWQRVAAHFDLLLDRPEAVDALEQTILQLATSGRLTARSPRDETSLTGANDRPNLAQPFDEPPGWAWVTVGQLTTLVTSGSRGWKDFYAAEGATFIRSQDIKFDRLAFDNRAYVKLPPSAEGVRTQVRPKDVLITITGANVGKAAVVATPLSEAYVSQHVALVRLKDPRLTDYLHLWLVNEHGGRRLLLASSYGAKPGLNLQNIKDLPVPLPPLEEQARIVARVTDLRRLCADLRQRLDASQTTQSHLADALVDCAAS